MCPLHLQNSREIRRVLLQIFDKTSKRKRVRILLAIPHPSSPDQFQMILYQIIIWRHAYIIRLKKSIFCCCRWAVSQTNHLQNMEIPDTLVLASLYLLNVNGFLLFIETFKLFYRSNRRFAYISTVNTIFQGRNFICEISS